LNTFDGNYDKNILKLINQNKETDEVAIEKIEKWKDISKIPKYIEFLIILIVAAYYLTDTKVAFHLTPIAIIFLLIN
jgi:hypothetical protein